MLASLYLCDEAVVILIAICFLPKLDVFCLPVLTSLSELKQPLALGLIIVFDLQSARLIELTKSNICTAPMPPPTFSVSLSDSQHQVHATGTVKSHHIPG